MHDNERRRERESGKIWKKFGNDVALRRCGRGRKKRKRGGKCSIVGGRIGERKIKIRKKNQARSKGEKREKEREKEK